MLTRALLVAACAAAIVLLAATGRSHRACEQARLDLFGVVLHGLPLSREEPALATLSRRCRGTDGLVAASGALLRQGRPARATAFALSATRREPESATAWNALASSARSVDPALARRAAVRARALSPLDRPPARPATPTARGGLSASP